LSLYKNSIFANADLKLKFEKNEEVPVVFFFAREGNWRNRQEKN